MQHFLGLVKNKVDQKCTQRINALHCPTRSVDDELFFCVTFSDTRAVFGATTGSILLGRVPSTRRRVHWVGPWPPSTSNNHRCIVGRRFVRSDVLATQSRAVFPESVACHFCGPPTSPESEYRGFGRPLPLAEGMVQGEGPLDLR